MFVETHILQNFALSNLNRDDSGAPKDCDFGGYRRARISSQCIKRSIRTYFNEHALLSPQNLSVRTKHLVQKLADQLAGEGRVREDALRVARAAMGSISLKVKERDKSEYLLFVGNSEIAGLAEVCARYWDQLLAAGRSQETDGATEVAATSETRGRRSKKDTPPAEYKPMVEKLLACLDGGEAADLALFGRMIANKPEKNVDAATQVAHAVSTNRVAMEFDFYTAVDDIPEYDPEAGQGAGMMGTVQYNSSCHYRYANLDLEQLLRNLNGNEALTRSAVRAFLEANILTVPTGKQTGSAAQNPPSFVLVVVREKGLWSLANAFVKPVRPDHDGDLVQNSVKALVDYWVKLEKAYGEDSIRYKGAVSLEEAPLADIAREPNLNKLLDRAVGLIQFNAVQRRG